MFPLSAPEMPVDAMSGSIRTCSSVSASGNDRQVRARMRDEQILGPGSVDGVAEAPAPERPAALRVRRVQAVEALPARRDGPDDHPLPDPELVVEPFAELVDDADRLVPEDQPRRGPGTRP